MCVRELSCEPACIHVHVCLCLFVFMRLCIYDGRRMCMDVFFETAKHGKFFPSGRTLTYLAAVEFVVFTYANHMEQRLDTVMQAASPCSEVGFSRILERQNQTIRFHHSATST